MIPLLRTENLRKQFGGLVAVDGVSLSVESDTLHAVIGPNGAGKTTLFNLLSGNLKPTSGRVYFDGNEITRLPVHQTAHLGIGRSFQITNLFPNLSVHENVRLAVQALGDDNLRLFTSEKSLTNYRERALAVLEQVGLHRRAEQPARFLGHGDQRKLELAMLLAPNPRLLLLDEPTAGMAVEEVPLLVEVIERIRAREGRTILLVEHKMDFVMSLSDRITVMHQGRVLAEGAPVQIASDPAVQSAYLGELYGELDVK